MNSWGQWSQSSGSGWYQAVSGATNVTALAYPSFVHPAPLPSVSEGLASPLSDREWLDAQIAEVCDLAAAA